MASTPTPDEIFLDTLISSPTEGRVLEFKTARSNYSFDKATEYCVAIANEGGGYLVLGVTDAVPREVVGTDAFGDPNEVELKILRRINVRVLVRLVIYYGIRVLVFQIPPRPPGTPLHVDGKYMMRVGESLVAMSADALRPIFAEPQGHFLERDAAVNLTWSDVMRLLDITPYFELTDRQLPTESDSTAEILSGERLIKAEAKGTYSITNLGAVLFARSLDSFPGLQFRRIRLTKYRGSSKIDATFDAFDTRGYAVAFSDLLEAANSHVPTNERIRESLRETVPLYPAVAIREFVANAMIHQDFEQDGIQLAIEFFDDRLEISNPGSPIISVTRFVDESRARNPLLADIMRRMGMCEIRGSGIDRVLEQNEVFQQPAPIFWTGSRTTKVVLNAHQDFADMKLEERVWAAFLHCTLRYVMGGYMTNGSLRTRFGLGDEKASMVSQVIGAAVEGGYIKLSAGAGTSKRMSKYVPSFA